MGIDELKREIFDDLASPAEFAKVINKSERTVRRMGFPTVMIGRNPYIVVSEAKKKLRGIVPRRGRGRPRKLPM